MGDLYLIGRIGDTWIGMPAEQVEAVVPLIDVVPVPHAPMSVRGMVAIRSRLLTLVDSAAVAQCDTASPSRLMVIVSIDGHGYGLTIDEVDDVVSFDAQQQIPATLSNGWRQLSSHMGEYGGRVILIVEPSRIIEEVQTVLAAAA